MSYRLQIHGQSHSRSLHPEEGRHKAPSTPEPNLSTPPHSRQKQHYSLRYNGIADRLSRAKPLPEWNLLPHATKKIFAKWSESDVDFFASADSAVVKPYVSRDSSDQHAIFIDAFSQPWHCKLGWLFPPPCLIPRVLAHLKKCKGEFLLVAPKWDQTFWMSDLSNRSKEQPLTIQNLETVLIDPTTSQPPQQVELLTLQVWIIGGGRT